jgi:hypothetical protein
VREPRRKASKATSIQSRYWFFTRLAFLGEGSLTTETDE